MMFQKAILISLLALFLGITDVFAGSSTVSGIDDQTSVEVTVYNGNLGLVKDTRELKLARGNGDLKFMDVASSILPYTVHVQSLTQGSGLSVLEQNYEYDLIDSNKLLDKYVGKNIKLLSVNEFQDKKETVEAVLLSNNNGQIYKINNEIYLGHPGRPILPELPENLVARPTLTWSYDNQIDGVQNIEVAYLTNNIGWKADYIVVVDKDDAMANLSGWVTLDNQSGATYKNAKLKLVAGDVNRVQDQGMLARREYAMSTQDASAPSFKEQSFFEYHLYDLQRPTTIKNHQTKQVSLLEADQVRLSKEYLVYGNQGYFQDNFGTGKAIKAPVSVYLKFRNSKENNMGMPLPQGTMRLYKADAQKSLQFIGEDSIKHTPKDEDVELKMGEAFDVTAERVLMDFKRMGTTVEFQWQLKVRNHKDSDVNVALVEPVYGDWEVMNSSQEYKKVDATTLRFQVKVPKNTEAVVTYRVSIQH